MTSNADYTNLIPVPCSRNSPTDEVPMIRATQFPWPIAYSKNIPKGTHIYFVAYHEEDPKIFERVHFTKSNDYRMNAHKDEWSNRLGTIEKEPAPPHRFNIWCDPNTIEIYPPEVIRAEDFDPGAIDCLEELERREPLHPAFETCQRLMDAKSTDYGSLDNSRRNYFKHGHLSYVTMLDTKMERINHMMRKMANGEQPTFESLKDTVEDLINYAAFYWSYLDDQEKGKETNR